MNTKKAEDVLSIKYVPLETVRQWNRNTKKHNITVIIESIRSYGFKDPLKYEPALNNGQGGIVEGNGRVEALNSMYRDRPGKPPRGIGLQDGKWMVPVLFGVDAQSQAAAEAYGIDHNVTTVLGGDEVDINMVMRMYQDETAAILKGLDGSGNRPVSITADDLDALLEAEREQLKEKHEDLTPKTMVRVLVSIPAAQALAAQEHIEKLKEIPGVEIDISGN